MQVLCGEICFHSLLCNRCLKTRCSKLYQRQRCLLLFRRTMSGQSWFFWIRIIFTHVLIIQHQYVSYQTCLGHSGSVCSSVCLLHDEHAPTSQTSPSLSVDPPVKRGVFLPTVAKSLLIGGFLIVGIFSVLLLIIKSILRRLLLRFGAI